MTDKPTHEFGKRRPPPVAPISSAPVKRSSHVALLLMGTLAVGGGAYALMPSENCPHTPPGMAASTECQPRGSSSGGGGSGGGSSRSNFFSGSSSSSDSSSGRSGSGGSESSSGSVQRGGFGSFAHAFAGHFSGG